MIRSFFCIKFSFCFNRLVDRWAQNKKPGQAGFTLDLPGFLLPLGSRLWFFSRSSDSRIIGNLLPSHRGEPRKWLSKSSLQIPSPITAAGPSRIYTVFRDAEKQQFCLTVSNQPKGRIIVKIIFWRLGYHVCLYKSLCRRLLKALISVLVVLAKALRPMLSNGFQMC